MKKSPEVGEFSKEGSFINGLDSHVLDMRTNIQLEESQFCQLVNQCSTQEVQFNEFCPGSIIAFRSVWVRERFTLLGLVDYIQIRARVKANVPGSITFRSVLVGGGGGGARIRRDDGIIVFLFIGFPSYPRLALLFN